MAKQKTVNGLTFTDYMGDLPESIGNEKRALLALLAEHGTEGQNEYIRAQQTAQTGRAAALEAAAARGQAIHAPAALQAELTQDYDRVLAGQNTNLTDALTSHGREMDRIAAANAAYLDSIRGAGTLQQQMINAAISRDALARRGGGGGSGSDTYSRPDTEPTVPLEILEGTAGAAHPLTNAFGRYPVAKGVSRTENTLGAQGTGYGIPAPLSASRRAIEQRSKAPSIWDMAAMEDFSRTQKTYPRRKKPATKSSRTSQIR